MNYIYLVKEFLYGPIELDLIKKLVNEPPHKIWWNFVSYIFDYTDHYIQLLCQPEVAATQNKSDEAIVGQITMNREAFVKTEYEILVSESIEFSNAFIVRSVLYFTSEQTFTWFNALTRYLKYGFNVLTQFKLDPLQKIILKTTSSHSEVTANPQSSEIRKINTRYANLIDKGILLETKYGICLPAYLRHNGYGFQANEKNFFTSVEEVEKDLAWAQFITVSAIG